MDTNLTKQQIADSLKKDSAAKHIEIDRSIDCCRLVMPVSYTTPSGQKVAIEIVDSPRMQYSEIVDRTKRYHKHDVSVLWIAPLDHYYAQGHSYLGSSALRELGREAGHNLIFCWNGREVVPCHVDGKDVLRHHEPRPVTSLTILATETIGSLHKAQADLMGIETIDLQIICDERFWRGYKAAADHGGRLNKQTMVWTVPKLFDTDPDSLAEMNLMRAGDDFTNTV